MRGSSYVEVEIVKPITGNRGGMGPRFLAVSLT